MAQGTKKTFTYTLRGAGPNEAFPYIDKLPFDSVAFYGTKARVPVKVTVNDVELKMSLAPMGGWHVLAFRRELAEEAHIAVGDTVRVTLERDDAERVVDVPPDLAKALRRNAAAKRAWDALAPSHKKEHANAIAEAKRPETRTRRVEKTLEMLTTAGRPARPAASKKPLATRLRIKPGQKVALLSPPKGFSLGVPVSRSLKNADVVFVFVERRAALKAWLPKLKKLAPSTALWFAYPKTTSGVKTDLTRDAGWEAAARAGLVPVTQVAVDATWSALRFRFR